MNITVGNFEIDEHAINLEVQYHPAASWTQARHEAARALVVQQLLLSESARRGLCTDPETLSARDAQQVIEQLTSEAVKVPPVTDSECEQFYRAEQQSFTGPQLFEASHILFAAPAGSADRAEVQTKAEQTLAAVLADPRHFERTAREHSACASATAGGRLGQITLGETLPEFERALLALAPGEITEQLVQTEHGFHIVRLDQRSEGRALPFEAVADRIRLYLRDRAWRLALRRFIDELAEQIGVIGFDLHAPPPQPSADEGAAPVARSAAQHDHHASDSGLIPVTSLTRGASGQATSPQPRHDSTSRGARRLPMVGT